MKSQRETITKGDEKGDLSKEIKVDKQENDFRFFKRRTENGSKRRL